FTKGNVIIAGTGGKVGVGTTSPNTSALLDISSTTKGFLLPRMTAAERNAISTPASGLQVYNTDTNQLNYYNGSSWQAIGATSITGQISNGVGNIPSMQLFNSGTAQDVVVYSVITNANGCAGPSINDSIYVNPDANASFTFIKDTACWPFKLEIENTSPNTANGRYDWYVDDKLIGSGEVFPGYTIPVSDTFADVKMVAISKYGCVNDTIIHRFFTKNDPKPEFKVDYPNPPCGPLTVKFQNITASNTRILIEPFSYAWDFGNNQTSSKENPDPVVFESNPNFNDTTYFVKLTVFNECVSKDTIVPITVSSAPKAQFSPSATNACSNKEIVFTNTSLGIGNTYSLDFGDGSPLVTSNTLDPIKHRYNTGVDTIFKAILTATNGCGSDVYKVPIKITPSKIKLNWFVTSPTQFGCAPHEVQIKNISTGASQFIWDFNDPNDPLPYVSGLNNETVTHTYTTPGIYNINVTAKNACTDTSAVRSVRVIRSPLTNFNIVNNYACPWSAVSFLNLTDTASNYKWYFGDPASGANDSSRLKDPTHIYTKPGVYNVRLEATLIDITGVACSTEKNLTVNIIAPAVQINAPPTGCVNDAVVFQPIVNSIAGLAPIKDTIWQINGVPYVPPAEFYPNFGHTFTQPGNYKITLIAGTTTGCYDTVSTSIRINSIPTISASSDQRICLGQSVQLFATSSVGNYQWTPLSGLSCYNCSSPVATPVSSTNYVVSTLDANGCKNRDTVKVIVIQPFKITVSPNDSICIGQSSQLTVNGAYSYLWSPSATLSCERCPNPVATPQLTTLYTVVGYDNFNCFTDTAKVVVGVGQYPVVTMPPDQTLATGVLFTIKPQLTNGPFKSYLWNPSVNLSCNDCENPVATIKNNVCYSLEATNIYGCSGSDVVCIKVFCENTQVFIPNAFTPQGGLPENSIFMVRGTGIGSIKSFRIFNRWGQVVFERSNFPPNSPAYGWNGDVNGIPAQPGVFVYTVEVVCDNGVPYFYKGNVTLIK
ncbi:MAG: PKD domain-containing protein, partial [Ferruginibacter sp.]|nr:PKD domain-containing protein [Ferruginibacter sp.]